MTKDLISREAANEIESIPADIAEKLGIRPIGGDTDA